MSPGDRSRNVSEPDNRAFQFGDFTLNAKNRELLLLGRVVKLPGKAFDILALLLDRAPSLVTKSEFSHEVWNGEAVCDANLTQHISDIRKALRQSGDSRFIQTVSRHGYRFVGEVRRFDSSDIHRCYDAECSERQLESGPRIRDLGIQESVKVMLDKQASALGKKSAS
jgi:DNA-binding winged helix-turn-helix (wHTH) protein